jgi:hypothetical protein
MRISSERGSLPSVSQNFTEPLADIAGGVWPNGVGCCFRLAAVTASGAPRPLASPRRDRACGGKVVQSARMSTVTLADGRRLVGNYDFMRDWWVVRLARARDPARDSRDVSVLWLPDASQLWPLRELPGVRVGGRPDDDL